jgi:4-amino-4-deoxy-L-arabinose transferase-like glycosyltransferase
MQASLRFNRGWFWFLASFLICSTRLFEFGTNYDSTIYSLAARHFSRNWTWFSISADNIQFSQFFEHPFLGIWLQGIVFAVLGPSDETARIVSLFFGAGSFFLLYQFARSLSNARYAGLYAFLNLCTVPYMKLIPTFYLDIPLFFFMLASIYTYKTAMKEGAWYQAAGSGALLGLAFLTKGAAALPALAAIGGLTVYYRKKGFIRARELWICLSVPLIIVSLFCVAQAHYGTYPFYLLYFKDSLIRRTLVPGISIGPGRFLLGLFKHSVLLLIIIPFSVLAYKKCSQTREVIIVGLICLIPFLVAGMLLGIPNEQYYVPLYPFLNMIACAALYFFILEREVPWERIAIVLAIAFQIWWQLMPFPLRKKYNADFYALRGLMSQFKERGIHKIEVIGGLPYGLLRNNFGLQAEVFDWYWDLPMVIVSGVDKTSGDLLLLSHGQKTARDEALKVGYRWCAGSQNFEIFTRLADFDSICENQMFKSEL